MGAEVWAEVQKFLDFSEEEMSNLRYMRSSLKAFAEFVKVGVAVAARGKKDGDMAKMLLAKVQFFEEEFEVAEGNCNEIIRMSHTLLIRLEEAEAHTNSE